MSDFSSEEYQWRYQRVREAMEREGLDAVIAYSNAKVQANVRYLANYYVRFAGMQTRPDGSYYMFGSCVCLLPLDGEPVVRTDQPWDTLRAKDISVLPDTDHSSAFGKDLGAVIRDRGYKRIGIDNWYLFPARDYLDLKETVPNAELIGTHLLSEVRRVKSEAELVFVRRAAEITDAACQAGMGAVRVGGSEYECALAADFKLRELGDLETAGGCIIGAGANSATGNWLPGRPYDHVIQAGEWVMFDVLPHYHGYSGDIARQRLAGDLSDLDPKLKKLHDTNVMMNREVIKAIKPGVSLLELKRISTAVAEQEGMLEYNTGLVGHGFGLDIHDIPDFFWDTSTLSAGECITVEPSLLIPGVAGARVEDLVLVTDTGHEVLTKTDRGLTPVSSELVATA